MKKEITLRPDRTFIPGEVYENEDPIPGGHAVYLISSIFLTDMKPLQESLQK